MSCFATGRWRSPDLHTSLSLQTAGPVIPPKIAAALAVAAFGRSLTIGSQHAFTPLADRPAMTHNPPTLAMQALARQLLANATAEQNNGSSSHVPIAAVFHALRRPLCRLAGVNGVRILLVRALKLATLKAGALTVVTVEADASLIGLDELSAAESSESGLQFLAQLLELLSAFVGERLTRSILADVWPNLNLNAERSEENQS